MPHTGTDRLQNSLGKKLARFLNHRRARRLYNEINREMAFFESRYLKSRPHHG